MSTPGAAPEALLQELRRDLAAVERYEEQHGSFPELVRAHYERTMAQFDVFVNPIAAARRRLSVRGRDAIGSRATHAATRLLHRSRRCASMPKVAGRLTPIVAVEWRGSLSSSFLD